MYVCHFQHFSQSLNLPLKGFIQKCKVYSLEEIHITSDAGLEIATNTVIFGTKLFPFASKIYGEVAK